MSNKFNAATRVLEAYDQAVESLTEKARNGDTQASINLKKIVKNRLFYTTCPDDYICPRCGEVGYLLMEGLCDCPAWGDDY